MFINPKTAIEKGWIKYPDWMTDEQKEKCVQPNALDVTADRLFKPNDAQFILSEKQKQMKGSEEITPNVKLHDELFWSIPPNSFVDVMSDFFIDVPPGVAAYFIVRSSLNRNGLYVTSGLYDQGFKNYCGFILHNRGNEALLAPHTRIAQLCFVHSEDSGKMYNGVYNQQTGEHWSGIMDQQYLKVSVPT